jgi:hypothetical protein
MNKPNILRIDAPIPNNKKSRKKAIHDSQTTKLQLVNKPDKTFKYAIELGARHIDKITTIQRHYRGWIVRYLNKIRGPGLFKRSLCNNQEDVYLFEPLETIHMNDFFSMLDKDGFIYGFHIESIHKYIEMNSDKVEITNPYNKNVIPTQIIANIKKLYKHCNSIGFHQKIDNTLPTDEKFQIRNKVLAVFQKMDELNNYTDIEWFLGLTHAQLYKLLNNTKDLFDYRMTLLPDKKFKILHNGTLFARANSYYRHLTFSGLRNEMADEFDRLVSQGETRDDKYLGSLIILTGLVELVPKCALAYPWLVQGTFNY